MHSHYRKLLGLKLNMRVFVAQDLIANSVEHLGVRGLPQRRIVDLCDDLGGDQDSDRDLQRPHQITQAAKDAVGPATFDPRNSVKIREAAKVAVESLPRSTRE